MSGSDKTMNPATEEMLETYPLMFRQEAEGIVEKTHDAFPGWRKTAHSANVPGSGTRPAHHQSRQP